MKLQASDLQLHEEGTPSQVLSCEFYEGFKNAFFIRTPLVAASVFLVKLLPHKTELTAQKMKLFIKDFFSKRDQIHSFLRMWSNLLKKSLVENFFSCSDYIKALQFVKITYTLFFEKLFLSHIHKRN